MAALRGWEGGGNNGIIRSLLRGDGGGIYPWTQEDQTMKIKIF